MDQSTYDLDLDRLTGSLETLSSVDTCLNNKDILEDLEEVEEIVKEINFEHNNCVPNYKIDIEELENDVIDMRKEIFHLTNSLEKIVVEFTTANEKGMHTGIFQKENNPKDLAGSLVKGFKQLEQRFQNEIIGPFEEVEEVQPIDSTTPVEHHAPSVDTLPIGIGIGAVGLAASGAAIAISDAKHKNEEKLEYYHPNKVSEEARYTPDLTQRRRDIEPFFDDPTPYYARRDKSSTDKFYE